MRIELPTEESTVDGNEEEAVVTGEVEDGVGEGCGVDDAIVFCLFAV